MYTFRNFVNGTQDESTPLFKFGTHEELVYHLSQKYPDEDIKWKMWYDSEKSNIGVTHPVQEYLVYHTVGILGSVSELPPVRSKRTVVCAANLTYYVDLDGQRKSIIVPGARHCDGVMAPILQFIRTHSLEADDGALAQKQGFIDQYGNFMSREEAYLLARSNKQMVVDAGKWPRERLYSEHLY